MKSMSTKKFVLCFAAALAIALLVMTLAWHIPFLLWDQLELAPIYQGWMGGHLGQTAFWDMQGSGHWHIAAYVMLLPAMWLTHGHPWLDCLLSWVFLLAYAAILLHQRARTLPIQGHVDLGIALLMTFLVLYPGHLFNLQFGYQLAVFQCLFGAAVTIAALCAPRLTWSLNFLAIGGAILGLLSFAVSYALFVVAFVMIAAHREMKWPMRLVHFLPWGALALLVYGFGHSAQSVLAAADPLRITEYTLYYLGGGIARFAPDVAPWAAAAGLIFTGFVAYAIRDRYAAMPWFGLMLFAVVGAVLTAVGRSFLGEANGALVPRYVSFSAAFWVGLLGLVARARIDRVRWHPALAVPLIALLVLGNAWQMIKDTREIGRASHGIAQTICRQWPNLDRSFLEGLIYSGSDAAKADLQILHDLDFAPFDACVAQAAAAK